MPAGCTREDQFRVEPILLVIAALLRQKQGPVRGRLGGVIDGDGLRLSEGGQSRE